MDRYERIRSGDWPHDAAPPDFWRMRRGERLTRDTGDRFADPARIALALAVLALLAAFAT
jgi:hypothetical protein